MSRETSRWLRFAGEGAVIVASILLALFLDTWWQNREDRAEERAVLAAIEEEFRANQEEIVRLLDAHQRHVRFMRRFFDSDATALEADPDSLATGLAEAFSRVMTLDPATRTLQALESSGRMTLIRDPEIRSGLALWSTYFEDSREEASHMLATLDRSVTLLYRARALREVPGIPLGRAEPDAVLRARANEEASAGAPLQIVGSGIERAREISKRVSRYNTRANRHCGRRRGRPLH